MTQKSKTETASETETVQDSATSEATKRVKVNLDGGKIADGAGFIHPVSKQLVTGDKVVSVPADDWTDTMIRDKTLTEVR